MLLEGGVWTICCHMNALANLNLQVGGGGGGGMQQEGGLLPSYYRIDT